MLAHGSGSDVISMGPMKLPATVLSTKASTVR